MLVLYNILLWAAALFLVPYYGCTMMLTGKYRKGFAQRFGVLSPEAVAGMKGSPRIWVHAVSVGEVTAAAPIIASLRAHMPAACIILSTTTETGQEMARRIITTASAFIYYPLDFSFAVRRAIDAVRPDIFILTETELWPNFIRHCRRQNVKIFMANGRLSPRSFRKYKFTRFFWKGILNVLDGVGAISAVDAERFRILGAPPDRLHVLGNAKYDSLATKASSALREEIGLRLNIGTKEQVLVAGSTHEGEETIIFSVYGELLKVYPSSKLIIVPRHIERAREVLALARETGFEDAIMMTEIAGGRKRRDERVTIVDVIGELFRVYSLATVVFCGGSLVPKGGQNIVEAAAWGKVIFYGPFMDDFLEERDSLESAGAGITVRDGKELLEGILKILADPDALARRGEEGRRIAAANMGASGRYAEYIKDLLPSPPGR
jgi:3-deoxy-D-manno-octulosonic-acid transferase